MPSLFDIDLSIQQRFEEFDGAHPDVYALFRRFALELLDAGRTHFSADAILHRIRWYYATSGPDRDGFKLNDHYSSRYARKLALEDRRFAEFFEFRKLQRS